MNEKIRLRIFSVQQYEFFCEEIIVTSELENIEERKKGCTQIESIFKLATSRNQ